MMMMMKQASNKKLDVRVLPHKLLQWRQNTCDLILLSKHGMEIASKASSSDPAKVFFLSGASCCSQQAYMHDNQRKRCILLPKCYKIVVS
jgi:hypothetical protein